MATSKKFSSIEKGVLICFGILFDVISFIPVVNVVSGIIGWSILYTIFFLKGVPLMRNRSVMATTVIAMVIGLIPGLSALPEFTVAIIISMRAFDKDDVNEIQANTVTRVERAPRNPNIE